MSHVRTQIRNKVATLLTGLTTTGARVYPGRVYPLNDADLPAISIYTAEEEVDEELGKTSRTQHRWVMITVLGSEKVKSSLYDTLDKISSEVETALFADRFLSRLVMALDLVSTTTEMNAELETPVGEIAITFRAQYLTNEGSPETVA